MSWKHRLRSYLGKLTTRATPPADASTARALDVLDLEDRIMYSAVPIDVTGIAEALDQPETSESLDAKINQLAAAFSELDGIDVRSPETETPVVEIETALEPLPPTDGTASEVSTELVFIDAAVHDVDHLLSDLQLQNDPTRELQYVLLKGGEDGIRQITDALAEVRDVDAVHIVSHGSTAGVQLGSSWLSRESFIEYRNELIQWDESIADGGDLLFYGCDLAATEDGRALMDAIGAACHCDVAASDDLTGHESLGGDWILEYSQGEVETNIVFGYAVQSSWEDTLATITVTTTDDENDGDTSSISSLQASSGGTGISLREAIIAANNTAGADTITLGTGVYVLDITGQAEEASATGDLDITTDITVNGAGVGVTSLDAAALSDRVFDISAAGTLTLNNLSVSNGSITNSGGGGVLNEGTLNATDVVFSGHSVTNSPGGAIDTSGTVNLSNVAIVNNTAAAGAGMRVTAGVTTMTNVTVSGNSSLYDGGGVSLTGGTLNVVHSTIADNQSTSSGGGGGINRSGGTLNMSYSIVADNTSPFGGNDLNGDFVSGGYNIIEHNSGFTGSVASDILGSDPGLSTLTLDNGTYVHTISSGSIAEDAATGSTATVDQRGISRSAVADIGAFENSSAPSDATLISSTQGGVSINDDGGNDAYFVADDGGAVIGGLSALTAEFRFSSTNHSTGSGHWFTLVSYDATGFGNELVVFVREDLGLVAMINDTNAALGAGTGSPLFDGEEHTLSFTWDNTAGDWEFFIDGVSAGSGTGLANGYTLAGGGELVFGQEQDGELSGWNRNQSFSGTYYDARIFSEARSVTEIRSNYRTNLPYDETAMVANWQFGNLSTDGIVTEVVSGNNLTLQHATGTGLHHKHAYTNTCHR